MRAGGAILWAVLLVCAPAVAQAEDAGVRVARRDAGPRIVRRDAGARARDAGVLDAGVPDAGMPDAGPAEPEDAGIAAAPAAEPPDAAESDAPPMLPAISGHAVFLLLLQLALLLIMARVGSELAKRVSLPAVVGELAAGIVLGPTIFGHYLPGAFHVVFPQEAAQFHLLEVVGMLGMVLLLLITGLETDLRLLRNLGRAALIASATGMVIPFASGFGLGVLLPDEYLAQPDHRMLFSLFLATAMAISAMPVIAKILMDLDLARRNIGLVILSAGVVDDTVGWLILSLIAGAAHGSVEVLALLRTLGLTLAFLAACAFVLYPALRWLMRASVERFKSPETDLVLIVVVTLLCAAATEWIGVHAVFGAFICGTVIRQVPRIREETVKRLESFIFQILAPVFFGIVGLKVDLWTLADGGGGTVLAIVIAVACFGKLFGCTIGSLWGGLRIWESLSIAVAMNARGAMGLVCAMVGLSLGILNQQMFSIIVVMSIVTSFMAPILLRLTMRGVRMTEEEQQRILAEETRGAVDPEHVRILLPTSENENAVGAAAFARGLANKSQSPIEIFHVDVRMRWYQRLLHPFTRASTRGFEERAKEVEAQLEGSQSMLRRVPASDVADAILEETQKGFDVIVVGATRNAQGSNLAGSMLEHVVAAAPCHVVIVKADAGTAPFKSVFVPFDGSLVSRIATEFAVRYAEGSGASLTLGVLVERRAEPLPAAGPTPDTLGLIREETLPGAPAPGYSTPEEELERISPIFKATSVKPIVERIEHDSRSSAMVDAVMAGHHDLVVLGAENRAVQHKLFFGHDAERLIRKASAGIAVVVPNISRLSTPGAH